MTLSTFQSLKVTKLDFIRNCFMARNREVMAPGHMELESLVMADVDINGSLFAVIKD